MKRISRRTLLRGTAGAAVALPMLECMLPNKDAEAQNIPKRYLLTFGGFSLNKGTSNGPTQQGFEPSNLGPGYDITPALAPLAAYNDGNGNPVRDKVSVVSGMDIAHANDLNNRPPASRYIGDSFHFHTGPLLCGVDQIHELDAEVIGASSDQVLWPVISPDTLFPYLCYRVQASFYNPLNGAGAGAHHRDTMSFESVNGSINDIRPQTSPRQAWLALTTPFSNEDPAKQLEVRKRKSVLDLVDRNMAGLLPKLSSWDRQRLDRHYQEIRTIENLLDADGTLSCTPMPDPGADPPVGGDFSKPFDWSVNAGYSDETTRAHTFTRLVHMAFVCDLTRVGTLMYTCFQSFMNIYQLINASFNQHAMNHNGTQSQLDQLIAWHVDQFADLVSLFRDTPEGSGSLLDNCALAFIPEGGYRTNTQQVPGGVSHNTENMCMLLAGGAGGLKQGEHIRVPSSSNHPVHVLNSMMSAVGGPSSLGVINGTIPALFG